MRSGKHGERGRAALLASLLLGAAACPRVGFTPPAEAGSGALAFHGASAALAGYSGITVLWNAAEGGDGTETYRVYRGTSLDGQDLSAPIAELEAGAELYLDPEPSTTPGLEYYYLVRVAWQGWEDDNQRQVHAAVPADVNELKRIQIIADGSGNAPPVGNLALQVGESVTLRAALFNFSSYIADVEVDWSLSGAFPASDLSLDAAPSATVTFTPSTIGQAMVLAAYAGEDLSVVEPTDTTGLITVSAPYDPAALQLHGGDEQRGTVGEALAAELAVQVRDAFDRPVAGAQVEFAVIQGDGVIETATPTIADEEGVARARARLGTLAGERSDHFKAGVDDHPALSVSFAASALPGPAVGLTFTAEPADADQVYARAPFPVVPRVALLDAFGNVAPSAGGAVAIGVATGSGALFGTTTVAHVAGEARFDGVGYDSAEAGVVLQATHEGRSALSRPFDVAGPPPGACLVDDDRFTTGGGGCTDLSTGLTWSRVITNTQWYEMVWDSALSGAEAADADDHGRSSDYPAGSGCPGVCDNDLRSNCHSLVEGGQTDWRVPSLDELYDLHWNARAGSSDYVVNLRAERLISSATLSSDHSMVRAVDPGGSRVYTDKWRRYSSLCVRAGRGAPAALEIVSGPERLGAGTPPRAALVVQVVDGLGGGVAVTGVAVSIEAPSQGALGGILSATTDSGGRARFDAFTLDTPGQVALTLTAPGLAPAQHDVMVGAFPSFCLVEDEAFVTAAGGCKHVATGLVWSLPSVARYDWYEAVWAHDPATGWNLAPDDGDLGRTNDYANDPGPYPDRDTLNYCHDLVEGGYSDWRLPSSDELDEVAGDGSGAGLHFFFDEDDRVWSASSTGAGDRAYFADLLSGYSTNYYKHDPYRVICVRGQRQWLDHLVVAQGPAVMAQGQPPFVELVVRMAEPDGTLAHREGQVVSLSATSLGALGGALSATSDRRGRATFDAFTLDTQGLAALTITSGGLTQVSHEIKVGPYPNTCLVEDAYFQSASGGCLHLPTGTVWSRAAPRSYTWFEVVWEHDAASGFNVAPDSDDDGRSDDYGNDPGSHPDSSTVNYCHELVEGGQSDWRPPRRDELYELAGEGAGAAVHLYFDPDRWFWSSDTTSAGDRAYAVNLLGGHHDDLVKWDSYAVICVR